MTKTQFQRWRSFAIRMAKTHYGKPQRGRLVEHVMVMAPNPEWILATVIHIVDGFRDRIERITDWDGSNTNDGIQRVCVCDVVDDESCNSEAVEAEPEMFYPDDRGPTEAWNAWDELWRSPVRVCLRSGLDLASKPSAGVVGFRVRDLRRMYPRGIPVWVSRGFCDNDGRPVDLNKATAGRQVHL